MCKTSPDIGPFISLSVIPNALFEFTEHFFGNLGNLTNLLFYKVTKFFDFKNEIQFA